TTAASTLTWRRCSSTSTRRSPAQARRPGLTLGQLELDPAVAAEGLFGEAALDRLELAEAGGGQAVRRDAFLDQHLDDLDRAGGRELPVRGEQEGRDRPDVGMAVDAQHPVD